MQDTSNSSLKRRLQIVDVVRKEGEARVEALSARLGVSTVTIRGDLNYLEQQGYVVRAFGKARYNPALRDGAPAVPWASGSQQGADAARLAQAALRWIDDGLSVFLGGGALVHRVVPQLAVRSGLTLSLHDLAMVGSARQFLQCEIHVVGGLLRHGEPGMVGPAAEAALRAQPIDVCVLEVGGIDAHGRVVSPHAGAARLYGAAVKHARKSIALAQGIEFPADAAHPVCSVGDFSAIAMHRDIQPTVIDLLAEHGLHVDRKAEGLLEFTT